MGRRKKTNKPGWVFQHCDSDVNVVYNQIYDLPFVHLNGDYTFAEIKKLVQIIFIKQTCRTQYFVTLTMIESLFERISAKIGNCTKKCDLQILENVFCDLDYPIKEDFWDKYPNISKLDYDLMIKILKRI